MSESNLLPAAAQWKRNVGDQSIYGKVVESRDERDREGYHQMAQTPGTSSTATNAESQYPPAVQHDAQKFMGASKVTGMAGVAGAPAGCGMSLARMDGSAGAMPLSMSAATNVIAGSLAQSSVMSGIGAALGATPATASDEEKLRKIQQVVEAGIGEHAKQQIVQILDRVAALKPPERLLLYLRMPGGTPETDPLRQPQNPLGTRSEINHTINWVRSHLEHDPEVSIPKQDVYNDYLAYCDRLDIKPLSTADFGKVMKQVFPEIRPRRLGTRGHSRYCYAAMRKTTKLTPPQLPELGKQSQSNAGDNFEYDENSWKTIKVWSEGLLNVTFKNFNELATHISKHHLNTPASNSSRLLLQKKLLQREAKEKRKFADAGPLKKRRKKKRKSSSSSETGPAATEQGQKQEIKQEIFDPAQPQLQLMPMNLATEHDRQTQPQPPPGTNSGCDTETSNLVALAQTAPTAPDAVEVNVNVVPSLGGALAMVKEEVIDEYNPSNVLCKKVRQAQQAKGLWAAGGTTAPFSPSMPDSVIATNYSMGPPATTPIQIDGQSVVASEPKVASTNTQQMRAKKLRLLQARHEILQQQYEQQQADSTDAPVLPENLGLPRERVISICNMDKHELDDYLKVGEEENSQDQEAELLQYFQADGGAGTTTTGSGTTSTAVGNSIYTNISSMGSQNSTRKQQCEEINQLRYYLHQNLNKDAEVTSSSVPKNSGMQKMASGSSYSGPYPTGSASASLAIMSQRHTSTAITEKNSHSDAYTNQRANKRKINLNARGYAPNNQNNSNARRKNFSFVPISPNINNPNEPYGLFASPRSTPVVRKPPLHKQQSLPSSDHNLSDPMIGAARGGRRGANMSTLTSASAPPSPSLIQQRFHFTNNGNICGGNPLLSSTPNTPNGGAVGLDQFVSGGGQLQSGVQVHNQNSLDCSLDGTSTSESRSQSVPLHCRSSPGFSQSHTYAGFSSACSSVAQTPVPTEYGDFSDPSTILDIFSESSQHQSIKLEDNSSSLLDVEPSDGFSELLGPDFDTKDPTLNSVVSRSVPSTPLPQLVGTGQLRNQRLFGNNNIALDTTKYTNKMYDASKSVPTTPIIGSSAMAFRYSPDYNRDFLINGNTVENMSYGGRGGRTANNQSVSIMGSSSTVGDGMDELGNFGDVTESIIDSDILDNL